MLMGIIKGEMKYKAMINERTICREKRDGRDEGVMCILYARLCSRDDMIMSSTSTVAHEKFTKRTWLIDCSILIEWREW